MMHWMYVYVWSFKLSILLSSDLTCIGTKQKEFLEYQTPFFEVDVFGLLSLYEKYSDLYNLLIVKVTMAHCCVCLIGEVKTDQVVKMESLWTFEFHSAWIFVKKILIGVQKSSRITGMSHITWSLHSSLYF